MHVSMTQSNRVRLNRAGWQELIVWVLAEVFVI